MKWRKMADHVQVSGGFMFWSPTFDPAARESVRTAIRAPPVRGAEAAFGRCAAQAPASAAEIKDVAATVDLWPAVIAGSGLVAASSR